MGELALVREAGGQGDLRQGQVRPCLQELLGPVDASGDDVLVRGQPGGGLELPGEVVGVETGSVNALEASSCSLLVLPTVCGLSSAQRAEPFIGSGAITQPTLLRRNLHFPKKATVGR